MSDPRTGTPCVAVLDVGKTNKKVHVYDSELNLVDTLSQNFEPVEWEGVPTEPSQAITEWMLDALARLGGRHSIRMISVATHGAAFACLGEDGELALPVIDYTFEPGEDFHGQFYAQMGSKESLQAETATLELKALINPGKAIAFLKERFPDQFARVNSILFYPQYFGFLLTGSKAADFTYAGCHTYLYDFTKNDYSRVADSLGIRGFLPSPIRSPGEVLGRIAPEVAGRTGLSPQTLVTVGIHDSNASLLPYLVQKPGRDLIVNSTGTWCVAMHPAKEVRFTQDELGKAVFYNMSALKEPVKTSILLGGLEFETYTTILKDRLGMTRFPEFDLELYRSLVVEKSQFILPTVVPGTGQYPDSVARIVDGDKVVSLSQFASADSRTPVSGGSAAPDLLSDARRLYAVLNLSLAVQTVTALRRVGLTAGTTVYTEGGFRNNPDYNMLLGALVPEARFVLSGMPEATSFGAALLGTAALRDVPIGSLATGFEVTEEEFEVPSIPGISEYAGALIAMCESDH